MVAYIKYMNNGKIYIIKLLLVNTVILINLVIKDNLFKPQSENLGGLPPRWIAYNVGNNYYSHYRMSIVWSCNEIRTMYLG